MTKRIYIYTYLNTVCVTDEEGNTIVTLTHVDKLYCRCDEDEARIFIETRVHPISDTALYIHEDDEVRIEWKTEDPKLDYPHIIRTGKDIINTISSFDEDEIESLDELVEYCK